MARVSTWRVSTWKASAMTNRRPNAVPSLVVLRRLARGLRGVGLSAAWLAGVGTAGAVVSMRQAYPRAPHAAPAQGWPPARPVSEGRLAVAVVLGASGSVITDAFGPYEVFARSPTFFVYTVSASHPPGRPGNTPPGRVQRLPAAGRHGPA